MDDKLWEKLFVVGLVLFVVASEATAQYCLKRCKLTHKWHFYVLAVLLYALVCFGLYNLYDYKSMGIVNLLWSCMSIIAIILVGAAFFHEAVTMYDIIGIGFVFVGLAFIFIKGHKK